MNSLTNDYYICEVVETGIDSMKSGGVRAKILGVTDDYADDDQPYVYPQLGNGLQQVPQKGYLLRVRFRDGNINMGEYYGMSQTKTFLPADYVAGYPNVAVGNCGEDTFFYVHDRAQHITTVTNPNSSKITWDASGNITHESSLAHNNAGMNAKSGGGRNVHPVLTEATIDIFTCMPVGHNRNNTGIGQGTEYLHVSHISQATIDAFNGNISANVTPNTSMGELDAASDSQMKDILDEKGGVVGSIYFEQIPIKNVSTRRNKQCKRIVICESGGVDFPTMSDKIIANGSTTSVHFLVGCVDGDPEIKGDRGELRNSGFVQYAEMKDDVMYGSKLKKGKDKINSDAVVIMLINSSKLDFSATDFQVEKVKQLITHIKKSFNVEDPCVITVSSTSLMFNKLVPILDAQISGFES